VYIVRRRDDAISDALELVAKGLLDEKGLRRYGLGNRTNLTPPQETVAFVVGWSRIAVVEFYTGGVGVHGRSSFVSLWGRGSLVICHLLFIAWTSPRC